jgi:3-oxoacyl-[acyl-carrier protein] reductase
LARAGYRLLVNYLSNDTAAAETLRLVRAEGSDGEPVKFDVSDFDAVARAIEAWKANHPGEYVEVLVNNAGIRNDGLMMWMERSQWDGVLNTSLGGFFNVTRALLIDMLKAKHGRIVNVVSLSGIKGLPGQTNYSAAKGGVVAATKALAQEVARKKVTVNAVAPGFIRTDMTADMDEGALRTLIPAGRFGEPEEVAAAVVFLVSPGADYITGEVISINGGLYT